MPTNEERSEVARKLRETSDEIRYWCDINPYWYVMKCIYGDVEIHDDNELFYRLADLIEPEPERKAKSKPFPVEKDTGYFDTTLCECGYLNDVSATYCGQCGCVIEVVHYAN